MEIRVPTLPSPCYSHYASASFSPLPSLGSSHATSLVKPLSTSSSSSHWRPTPITSTRRFPLLVRFSAIDTPAELQSNLKVTNSIQYPTLLLLVSVTPHHYAVTHWYPTKIVFTFLVHCSKLSSIKI